MRYFIWVQFYKINYLGSAAHARQSLNFQKVTETLKIYIFSENVQIHTYLPFTSKNNRNKENFKLASVYIFLGPKIDFDLDKEKVIFFRVSVYF